MNSILLIEDDRKFAQGFAEIAGRMTGVAVEQAPSMEAAEELLRRARFDVIVLDLTLDDAGPKGSIAAIQRLRHCAPVVVMTGATGEKAGLFRNLAMFNGASSFIQKDHLGLGGAWPLALSIILDAHLRERRSRLQTEEAA